MKNKILSLVLALLMTASSASAVLADDVVAIAEEPVAVEAVVEETEAGEYDAAIEFLANYGIFKGYDKDNTGAADPIERYQMALFVARIATGWTDDEVWENGKDQWTNFSDIDVDPVNKYFGALSFAAQNKIIEGYGNGKFGPQDKINYQNALTMVVRTLGYTNLDWPWGYIQKAVELRLTEGISGVAYTDDLTRGEVAQIIYNAMFAKTKDGTTLALKNFDIEFGWEKVVITASNTNTFTKTNDATGVEKQFVEFKLLNDDGSLGDDAYKALASSFELDYEAHEDDLAVGKVYYVLFEKDAASDLVEIVAAEDLYVDTLWNTGKGNDYEIKDFFDEYTLVEKYTGNNYLGVTASLKPEIMVWDKVDGITSKVVDGYEMAFDWATGDILAYTIKDNKKVDVNKDGEITADDMEVVWHRIPQIDKYYKIEKNADGLVTGITMMNDDELAKFFDAVSVKSDKSYKGFYQYTSAPATSAYASLDLYNVDPFDNDVCDRALYETYALGYFNNTTSKCSKCDKEYEFWSFSNVGTFAKAAKAAKIIDKNAELEASVVYGAFPEATCDHQGAAWFVEGYEPMVDEDGEYVDSYVIYNVDKETGAIKVVKTIKNIADADDEDNYVATGVLRAYNVGKKTITIGDDKRTMDYNELIGNGFYKMTENEGVKDVYDEYFRSLFNQFVKYVVVDGEVVHVEPTGTSSRTELIVVEGYKGLSADGYIVVDGYSTTDLDYAEFRLGSIDGWKKGDAYYNEDAYADALRTGAVLEVVTYDKDEDAYFVEQINEWYGQDGWDFVEGFENSFILVETDWGHDYDNYLTKTPRTSDKRDWDWDKSSYAKMSSSDNWILVTTNPQWDYSVIYVYTGKLPEGTSFEGDLVYENTDEKVRVLVNVQFNNGELPRALDGYNAGIVILATDSFDYMDYNGEYAEDDRYILGGVKYEGRAVNVLNGDLKAPVLAFNDDAEVGYAYYTKAGVIAYNTNRWYSAGSIADMVGAAFSEDTYFARALNVWTENEDGTYSYTVIGHDKNNEEVTFEKLYDTDKNKMAVEALILGQLGEIDGSRKHLGNIDSIDYRVIKIGEKTDRYGNVSGRYIEKVDASIAGDKGAKAFIAEAAKYSTLEAFYVYNVEARKIVIYLVDGLENVLVPTEGTAQITAACTTGIDGVKGNEKYVVLTGANGEARTTEYYEASHGVDYEEVVLAATEINLATKILDDDITEAAVTSLTVGFVGETIDEFLADVDCGDHEDGCLIDTFSFGTKGATAHDYGLGTCLEDAETYATINGEHVCISAVAEAVHHKDADCGYIQALTFTLAEKVYFEDYAVVEITFINPKNGLEVSLSFDLTVVDEVEVLKNGEMNECDVCGEVYENGNYRTKIVEDKVLANVCDDLYYVWAHVPEHFC